MCAIIQSSKTFAQDTPLIIARTSSSDAFWTDVPFLGENLPVAWSHDRLQNGHLSRTAHVIGLGMFHKLLDYKAMEAGVAVVAVKPAYTSQTCSGCGDVDPKGLGVRVHEYPACGLKHDRDVNAALNILSAGTRPPDANVSRRAVRSLGSPRFSEESRHKRLNDLFYLIVRR